MSKVLVFGGTRFFGKKLVTKLVEEGHNVTIATRGNSPHPFGKQVSHIIVDRTNEEMLANVFKDSQWDIIYDNICYSPNEALAACRVFNGKVKKYIFTSTMATYDLTLGANLKEDAFDPYHYPIHFGSSADFSYGEGKRLAEAEFFKDASFPVVAVRFPIVLGEDDYTKRLHFHIEQVANGQETRFANLHAKMSFISSDDAADFLKFIGFSHVDGPINATSTGAYTMEELMHIIESAVGKKAKMTIEGDSGKWSPFAVKKDFYMCANKSMEAGFTCKPLEAWLPHLIDVLANEYK